MRHRKAGLKLNRNSSHRKAMFRNMVTSLFKYEHIRTTDAKAKGLRGLADHLITLAKRGDLHARRQALAIIREKDVVHKLFNEAPGRYANVSGGYTRVVKIGRRPGDAAIMSLIELVAPESDKEAKNPKVKKESVQAIKSTKDVEKKVKEAPKPKEKPEEKPEEKKDKEAAAEVPVNPESDKPTE